MDREGGAVNDYLVHEMARVRIDELRAEASRGGAARGWRGWRNYLGILGVSGACTSECGSFFGQTVEEAWCA
jgi:hypothetical protein